jgi:hypothetical protein
MKKKDFDKLSLKAKGRIVLIEQGKFIAKRDYYNQKLELYDMGNYFAEVWYEPTSSLFHRIDSLFDDDKNIDLFTTYRKNFPLNKVRWVYNRI